MPWNRLFVGRHEELDALRGLVEDVVRGGGRLAVLEGEAGIGKTRLVDELVAAVRERRWQVARAHGEELGRDRPFGVVADAFGIVRGSPDPERGRVAELLVGPPADALEAPVRDLRFHLVESICDLVERDSAARPMLVVAEDLHWADASSLLTLNRLARRAPHVRALVVVTARPLPRAAELAHLLDAFGDLGATTLRLAPLSDEAVAELAASTLGASLGPRLRAELGRAGGNPLFARELLDALRAERCIAFADEEAELERSTEPAASLRVTILRRLSSLPPDALDLLRLAAVLGGTFTFDDLAAVAARRPSELVPALAEAVEGQFLVASGEQLAFRHDLVREALYLDVPQAVRRALHREVGRALAAAGTSAPRVALHLARSAAAGDDEAIEWLRRAAGDVARTDPAATIEFLQRALELLAPDDARHDEVRAALILPLVWLGRVQDAEDAARAILARTTDSRLAADVYHSIIGVLYLHQRLPRLAEVCDAALALPDLPQGKRAVFLGDSTIALLGLGRVEEALERADAALTAGRATGDPLALMLGTWAHAQVALLRGRVSDAVEIVRPVAAHAEAALARKDTVGVLHLGNSRFATAHKILGWVLLAADRLGEATASLEESLRAFERGGVFAYTSILHRNLATARFALGEWDDALAESRSAWLLAEETGVHGLRAYHGDPSPLIHLHRGDLTAAGEELSRIERALGDERPLLADLWLLPQRAFVAEAAGDEELALELLERTCELAERLELLPDYRTVGAPLVRLALARGRRELAVRTSEGATELARRAGVARAEGAALLCRGLLDDDPDLLAAGVAAYRRAPVVLDLALACEEAGAAAARHERQPEAVELLAEALELYDALAAARDAARVRRHLRSLGVRHGARTRRNRDRGGWESVTPSELRVVELLAQGLSNPEIAERLYISRRTVRSHLENVFRKLGVSSRAELAAISARRNVSPPAASAP